MSENRQSTSSNSHLATASSPSRFTMDQGIKNEPIRDEERPMELLDHDYCLLMPELEEIDDFLEPKLEEPEYFYTEQPDIKLELVEVVKQELLVPKTEKLDDFHTEQPDFEFEPLELKLENPEYSEMDCSFEYSAQESSTEPEMNSPCNSTDLNIIRHKRNPPTYKCQLCSSFELSDKISHIYSKEKRLVPLIGMICAGKKTKEEVQQLITRQKIIIRKIHQSEAVDEIYKTLNIKNIHEIDSCSEENKQKLMDVVKVLCGDTNFDCFIGFITDFLKKIDPSFMPICIKESSWIRIEPTRKYICSVCSWIGYGSQIANTSSRLTCILSRGRLLVLMVGCVLSGKKTMKEAQLLLSKNSILSCKMHTSEVINEIFKAANIKNVDEMMTCSMENQKYLMSIVNVLCPHVCFSEFRSLFRTFCLNSCL